MARKRTPCEWCNTEQFIRIAEGAQNVDAVLEIYPDNGLIGISVQAINDEGEVTAAQDINIPLHYCPNCGRKLDW